LYPRGSRGASTGGPKPARKRPTSLHRPRVGKRQRTMKLPSSRVWSRHWWGCPRVLAGTLGAPRHGAVAARAVDGRVPSRPARGSQVHLPARRAHAAPGPAAHPAQRVGGGEMCGNFSPGEARLPRPESRPDSGLQQPFHPSQAGRQVPRARRVQEPPQGTESQES
jgi:hypothetical protein